MLGAAAAGSCRQRAGCKQASTTSESEVDDEDKSSQYGDRRVHVEKAYSNSAKVSQLALAVALARRGSYDLC